LTIGLVYRWALIYEVAPGIAVAAELAAVDLVGLLLLRLTAIESAVSGRVHRSQSQIFPTLLSGP